MNQWEQQIMGKEGQVSIKYLQHGMQLKDFVFFSQGKNYRELGAKPVAWEEKKWV